MSKQTFIVLFVVILMVFFNQAAFASATAGGGLPFDSWLVKVQSSITGPFAFGVSVLGIVGAGAMLIFGGQEINAFLRALIYLVLVISFVIAAKNMLSAITGVGAEIAFNDILMVLRPHFYVA